MFSNLLSETLFHFLLLNINVFMKDAPTGTGKTFTEKVICAELRARGKLVLCVASTGIAAFQLPGGWTAHSMSILPFE